MINFRPFSKKLGNIWFPWLTLKPSRKDFYQLNKVILVNALSSVCIKKRQEKDTHVGFLNNENHGVFLPNKDKERFVSFLERNPTMSQKNCSFFNLLNT